MSQAYEKFAIDTYQKAYDEIKKSLATSGDLPVLVVSAADLQDSDKEKSWNSFTEDSEEEPALAGAYSHISAIQAAVDLVGKENVVVHFTADEEQMDANYSRIDRFQTFGAPPIYPIDETIKFINENGYNMPTDPKRSDNVEDIIEDIGRLASLSPTSPKVVVHIAPTMLIGHLQGHSRGDIISNKGRDLINDPEKSPFLGIYADPVFLNSGRHTSIRFGEPDSWEKHYSENPENAIQFDAPGQMDESDKENIAQRIVNASNAVIAESTRNMLGNAEEIEPSTSQLKLK